MKPHIMAEARRLLEAASPNAPLYDHFSKTKPEFINKVVGEAYKLYGRDFGKKIDARHGPGAWKKLVDQMWDKHYSDSEAVDEIGFYFDISQQGESGYGSAGAYDHNLQDKFDYINGELHKRLQRVMDPKGFEDPRLHDPNPY